MSGEVFGITYRVRSPEADITARAEAILLEQTVELPRSALRTPFVRENMVGRVRLIAPDGEGCFRVVIEQPAACTAGDPAQFLNVLFGNTSLQPDVELEDLEIPETMSRSLPGPRFGIDGIRGLCGSGNQAMAASAIKPMGLDPREAGALCRTLALAGLDLVKDDHGLADHAFCPFGERIRACLAATLDAAQETGKRTLYVPNLIGSPATVLSQAREARDLGVAAVMVSPMLVGLPLLAELAGTIGIPVLAHPAFGGALRISPRALLGRLFPAFGADAVIFPNAGGRFSYSAGVCAELASALREPVRGSKGALPVPAGGIRFENVGRVLDFYGPRTMLLVGGSLIDAGDDREILARGRQFVSAVHDHPYRS